MGEAEALQNNEEALQAEYAVTKKDPVVLDPTFRFHSKAPTGKLNNLILPYPKTLKSGIAIVLL